IYKDYLQSDFTIVHLEPSCFTAFIDDIPDLVQTDDAKKLKEKSMTFEDYLLSILDDTEIKWSSKTQDVLYHAHCHLKGEGMTNNVLKLLEKIPAIDAKLIDSGCCGMAGAFGYEEEHYEISMKIANQRLFPAIKEASDNTVIVANGHSCRCQIYDGLDKKAVHIAQLLETHLS
ncbi:MAG: FAD-binding oxidoreductase, partial [Lentisphaeria bacterium]|nr:heterodisulfide reductase-related iron-sulfur binding cluster [Lentisphaeria bacterium]NQZ67773.1 FAD-binding oxidoreductase [Lentisphaeria bacterium]